MEAIEQLAALDNEIASAEAERKLQAEPQERAAQRLRSNIATLTEDVAVGNRALTALRDELRGLIVDESLGTASAEGGKRTRAAIKTQQAAVDIAIEEIEITRSALAEVEARAHPLDQKLHVLAKRREQLLRQCVREYAEQLAERLRTAYRAAGELFAQVNAAAQILSERERVGTTQPVLDVRYAFAPFAGDRIVGLPGFPALSAFAELQTPEMAIVFRKLPRAEERFGYEWVDPAAIRARVESQLKELGIFN